MSKVDSQQCQTEVQQDNSQHQTEAQRDNSQQCQTEVQQDNSQHQTEAQRDNSQQCQTEVQQDNRQQCQTEVQQDNSQQCQTEVQQDNSQQCQTETEQVDCQQDQTENPESQQEIAYLESQTEDQQQMPDTVSDIGDAALFLPRRKLYATSMKMLIVILLWDTIGNPRHNDHPDISPFESEPQQKWLE